MLKEFELPQPTFSCRSSVELAAIMLEDTRRHCPLFDKIKHGFCSLESACHYDMHYNFIYICLGTEIEGLQEFKGLQEFNLVQQGRKAMYNHYYNHYYTHSYP